jgi:hypothetical protein
MLRKFRWSKVYESSEEELTALLRARNITAVHSAREAFDKSTPEPANKETTIWCAEGSLSVFVNEETVSLQPGDALRMPAKMPYRLDAGISGYTCYTSLG